MKKRKLSDIDVNYISLVRKGANDKTVILKAADTAPVFQKTIEIKKNVDGVLYGIVYAPDEMDLQGDMASAGEIKKAAYAFMSNEAVHQIDREHNGQTGGAFVAESWIVRKSDALFPDEKPGAWAVGLKLTDANLIAAVQKGAITGLSMAGNAKTEAVEKTNGSYTEAILKGLVETIRASFGKSGKGDTMNDIKQISDAVSEGFETVSKEIATVADDNAAIIKRMDAVEARLKKSGQDTRLASPDGSEGIV